MRPTTATRAAEERTRPSGTASARWKTNTSVNGATSGAEAAEEGRGVLRALPVRAEPREAGEQREHAEAPGSRLGRGEPARREQSEAGREVGHPCGGERGGVGGLEVAAVIDRE